ncbi:MAG: hypothetical protein ABSB57_00350 [Dehalococcoidia bacterium]
MRLTRVEREAIRRLEEELGAKARELEKLPLSEREALAPVEWLRRGLLAERLARVVGEPGG